MCDHHLLIKGGVKVWIQLYRWGAIAVLYMSLTCGLYEDKVCYLEGGEPVCNRHRLRCLRQEIAIVSIQYSYTENCTCEMGKCTSCTGTGRSTPLTDSVKCINEYPDEDYWNIVSTCSKRHECYYDVPSHKHYKECSSFIAFSHIWYRCVNGSFQTDMCGDDKRVGNEVSIFYDGSVKPTPGHRCVCNITAVNRQITDKYHFKVLDIRQGGDRVQDGSNLVLSHYGVDNPIAVGKKRERPNTVLLSSSLSVPMIISLDANITLERIWILVLGENSSAVRVECGTVMSQDGKEGGEEEADAEVQSNTVYFVTVGTPVGLTVLVIFVLFIVYIQKRVKVTTEVLPGDHKRQGNVSSSVDDLHNKNQLDKPSTVQNSAAIRTEEVDNSTKYNYVDIDMESSHSGLKSSDIQIPTSESSQSEDLYNCLGTSGTKQSFPDANYDTMISAVQSVKQLAQQDDYSGYDHLGTSVKKEVVENDYDTTC